MTVNQEFVKEFGMYAAELKKMGRRKILPAYSGGNRLRRNPCRTRQFQQNSGTGNQEKQICIVMITGH